MFNTTKTNRKSQSNQIKSKENRKTKKAMESVLVPRDNPRDKQIPYCFFHIIIIIIIIITILLHCTLSTLVLEYAACMYLLRPRSTDSKRKKNSAARCTTSSTTVGTASFLPVLCSRNIFFTGVICAGTGAGWSCGVCVAEGGRRRCTTHNGHNNQPTSRRSTRTERCHQSNEGEKSWKGKMCKCN